MKYNNELVDIDKIIKNINKYYDKKSFNNKNNEFIDYYYNLYIIRIYKNMKKVKIIYENMENFEIYDVYIINLIYKSLSIRNILKINDNSNKKNFNFLFLYQKNICDKILYSYFKNITYKRYNIYNEWKIWSKDVLFGFSISIIIELYNDFKIKVFWINNKKEKIISYYNNLYIFIEDLEFKIINNVYRTQSGLKIK